MYLFCFHYPLSLQEMGSFGMHLLLKALESMEILAGFMYTFPKTVVCYNNTIIVHSGEYTILD